MLNSKTLKILWAVDAFDDQSGVKENEVRMLQTFARRTTIEVDPVYVLSPLELGVALEFSPHWTGTYIPSAKKALAQVLKGVKIPGLREPQVQVHDRPSLRGSVQVFADYASKNSYDLIIAGSHGRSGFQRLMLGSFAEQLLLCSEVPVLVVGSHSERWPDDENDQNMRILFPNELDQPGSSVLNEALDFARTIGAKVTLLHSIPRPVEQVFQSGVYLLSGGWIPVPVFIEKQRLKKEEAAGKFMSLAQQRGVDCNLSIDDTSLSITESIFKHARDTKAGLIVMEAESGPVSTSILGSVTRQIVRSATCPVLVIRRKRE